MTKKELQEVQDTIENEGFQYAFEDYSDFEEIKDEKFHELRKAFCKSIKDLREYLKLED